MWLNDFKGYKFATIKDGLLDLKYKILELHRDKPFDYVRIYTINKKQYVLEAKASRYESTYRYVITFHHYFVNKPGEVVKWVVYRYNIKPIPYFLMDYDKKNYQIMNII